MLDGTRRWLRRNRNGIAIGFGVVGAAYFAGQYVLNKISEARERMALDKRAKEDLRRRFEQNQRDCTFTVLALLPTVTENIVDGLPVEQLTNELQQKKAERLARMGQEASPSEVSGITSTTDGGDAAASSSSLQGSGYVHASQMGESSLGGTASQPKRTKAQLWNELKINSITRALAMLYTLSLLTLLTRIQLNLLGRRNYLSSVVSMTSPVDNFTNRIALRDNDDGADFNTFGNDFDTNRKYLTFSWWLLHRGYQEIITRVSNAVKEVFGPIPPTEVFTPSRLSSLILLVRQKVEGVTEDDRQSLRWLQYLLPPQEEESTVLLESGVITPPSENSPPPSPSSSSQLRRLLDETADLIDSPHFNSINTQILNTLFTQLIDNQVLSQAFPPSTPQAHPPQLTDPSSSVTVIPAQSSPEPRTKLAGILAVFTRQAHTIGSSSTIAPTSAPTTASATESSNPYIASISREVSTLESFAAVIYSSNLQEEGEALANSISELQAQTQTLRNMRSMDSISQAELRESLGLDPRTGRSAKESVGSHLEKVWERARGLSVAGHR